MSILANSNAIESGGYNIDRSLRFRSSASSYLNRTPASASNRKTWTYSAWVKRGSPTSDEDYLFVANAGGAETAIMFPKNNGAFGADDTLCVYLYSGGFVWRKVTTQVFRDYSAWYHIVVVLDTDNATAEDRLRVYVNGSRVTSWSVSSSPSLGYAGSSINNTVVHEIGSAFTSSRFFDGYLAEVNFIDGQALTPSSFGETSTETGVWVPKKYTGTYGTNGFYLNFSDNTSATTLAYDKSGNGNNWTANNISTTAGATYDSMTDVPTLTSATAANYCVANPLDKQSDISVGQGNLYFSTTAGNGNKQIRGTIALPLSGKFYWETKNTGSSNNFSMGISDTTASLSAEGTGDVIYNEGGYIINNGSATSGYATLALNDVVGVAVDVDANKIYWYKNNTLVNSGGTTINISAPYAPMFGLYTNGNAQNVNFGQRPFSYTPPTGFKALNTFNLPDPTIKKPNQYMDATLYTGNATAGTNITNAAGFQPDLVWLKSRSNATNHKLLDSARGPEWALSSDLTNADIATTNFAFLSNGFSLPAGTNFNGSGYTYVGWQWKESATAGFDIVTYTGTGSATTFAHSLGVAPAMMIQKIRSSAGYNWHVYHKSLPSASYFLRLNTTGAQESDTSVWNGTAPTSTVFSVGTYAGVNFSGATYVNYLFAEIPGFSKFGSYTGNGSADGPFVYCGFRPKYVMVKRTDSTGSWCIVDTSRDPYNATDKGLIANTSDAEGTGYTLDYVSNGFKVRLSGTAYNASGGTYVYAAFAEQPFRFANAR